MKVTGTPLPAFDRREVARPRHRRDGPHPHRQVGLRRHAGHHRPRLRRRQAPDGRVRRPLVPALPGGGAAARRSWPKDGVFDGVDVTAVATGTNDQATELPAVGVVEGREVAVPGDGRQPDGHRRPQAYGLTSYPYFVFVERRRHRRRPRRAARSPSDQIKANIDGAQGGQGPAHHVARDESSARARPSCSSRRRRRGRGGGAACGSRWCA